MNTDSMIAVALDTHADRVRTGTRERLATDAAAARPHRTTMRRVRVSLGAVLVAVGSRLQGIATTLPESTAPTPGLPVGPTAR